MSKSAKAKSRRINLTLPAYYYELVERMAKRRGESLSGFVATLIKAYVLSLTEDYYFAVYDERKKDLANFVKDTLETEGATLEQTKAISELNEKLDKVYKEQRKQGRNINQLAKHANRVTGDLSAEKREQVFKVLMKITKDNEAITRRLEEVMTHADNVL